MTVYCRLKACRKCGGDLVLDGDEWRCWQCGQYYYPIQALLEMPEEPPDPELLPADGEVPAVGELAVGELNERRPRRQRAHRSPRNINSRITAKDRSDRRWCLRNWEVIRHLDQGLSVREISRLVARGERQIRIVRERLNELRAAGVAAALFRPRSG